MSITYDYDLIALGAGSGGLSVVERAASYGQKCAIVEHGKMGGTCVNVGCVPKKIMWFGANLAHLIDDAKSYGFEVKSNSFNWAHLRSFAGVSMGMVCIIVLAISIGYTQIHVKLPDKPQASTLLVQFGSVVLSSFSLKRSYEAKYTPNDGISRAQDTLHPL